MSDGAELRFTYAKAFIVEMDSFIYALIALSFIYLAALVHP